MEAVIFISVAVWMMKTAAHRANGRATDNVHFEMPNSRFEISKSALPLALFLIFILFQLLPLPPFLLKVLSPQTFEYYSHTLPGWPERALYKEIGEQKVATDDFEFQISNVKFQLPAPRFPLSPTWLPVSLAPGLTRIALLKLVAYTGLFFLVLLYPFGPFISKFEIRNSKSSNLSSATRAEDRFLYALLIAVFFTGVLVAAIGFIQRFSWNGKILWFFIPYDWGVAAHTAAPRASGPFVDADHFANYLGLIFPLAVACALFCISTVRKRLQPALLIACAVCVLILFTAILLSLSRGGWTGALLGLVILVWLCPWRLSAAGRKHGGESTEQGARSRQDEGQGNHFKIRLANFAIFRLNHGVHRFFKKPEASLARISFIVFPLLLIVSLFFVGPDAREQVDMRLGETVVDASGLWGRTMLWNDSLGMLHDFPLFGVGLGAWPELFVRYQRPPWSLSFYREAHNDYLQLLAETGVVGFILLAWFFFRQGKLLIRAVKNTSPRLLPLMAGIVAALGTMAFHEFFDFNLQIPANAFLFTLLFAVGLRMARSAQQIGRSDESSYRTSKSAWRKFASPLTPFIAAVFAVVLAICALTQEQIPYPYNHNSAKPASLIQAKDAIIAHPTSAALHLTLLRLMGNTAPASQQLAESEAALWIEPRNPYLRDFYAATLLKLGKQQQALTEITRSVAASPSLGTHFYLSEDSIRRLSRAEQNSVEEGFKQALARDDRAAPDHLAAFYAKLERFSDQGALYEKMALAERDPAKRIEPLLNAGLAYLKAHDEANAELLFRKAIATSPADPRAYQQLATEIFGPNNFPGAEQIVFEGIKNRAPAVSLYLSLADAAQKTGSSSEIKRALMLAQNEIDKTAKETGEADRLYLALADGSRKVGDREQEITALQNALKLRPQSQDILFRLGNVSLDQQNFDRAALYFARLTSVNTTSPEAYYSLALAEEGRYRFAAADKAYARAVALAPDNTSFLSRYDQFKHRVTQNR